MVENAKSFKNQITKNHELMDNKFDSFCVSVTYELKSMDERVSSRLDSSPSSVTPPGGKVRSRRGVGATHMRGALLLSGSWMFPLRRTFLLLLFQSGGPSAKIVIILSLLNSRIVVPLFFAPLITSLMRRRTRQLGGMNPLKLTRWTSLPHSQLILNP